MNAAGGDRKEAGAVRRSVRMDVEEFVANRGGRRDVGTPAGTLPVTPAGRPSTG